jgi:methionyl-tRNA formyltransferase
MITLPAPPRHPRRLVYLGTPEMAVPPLRALHAVGHDIALVVSRADKRRGRGSELLPSPVKAAALELGLRVTDDIDEALDVGADLGVVVAYGRIIRANLLERIPMVNLHFSLLPRWRGAAPVERAILAGDERTGVDLMVVEEGLDTGGIYAEEVLDIGPDETAAELRARLVDAGTRLLLETLATGIGEPRAQTGDTVYAEKLLPPDFEIDWTRPAIDIHRLVRVGGAWTTFRGKRFKIWRTQLAATPDAALAAGATDGHRVGTGDGGLELLEVQPEGKGRQPADAWRNGAQPTSADRFGA